MIPLETLERMFSNIREKTPWNIDGPMLWGYFFFDPDKARLTRLAAQLSSEGYRVVDVAPTDDEDQCRLHVEKVEVHSPETLHERNAALQDLAERYGVETYDGMDVGPVTQ